jgi:hypothetical protein
VRKLAIFRSAYQWFSLKILSGSPLSPFVFLVIAKALRRLINRACHSGKLKGLKVEYSLEYLSHLLSMDDILCFVQGSSQNFLSLKSILDLLCRATGTLVNYLKSCVIPRRISKVYLKRIKYSLLFPRKELEVGFKHMGFFLNLDGYKTGDWNWLYNKVGSHISFWGIFLLSQGGRIILVKFVLESISVYWNSISIMLKGVLTMIKKSQFLFSVVWWESIKCHYIGQME